MFVVVKVVGLVGKVVGKGALVIGFGKEIGFVHPPVLFPFFTCFTVQHAALIEKYNSDQFWSSNKNNSCRQ